MNLQTQLQFPQGGGEGTFSLRLKLLGALVGLARSTDGAAKLYDSTWQTAIHGICALYEPLTEAELGAWVETCHQEKFRIVPDCAVCQSPCGRTFDYDAALLSQEEAGEAKCTLLKAVLPLARQVWQAAEEGRRDENAITHIYRCLFILGEYVDPSDVLERMNELTAFHPQFKS